MTQELILQEAYAKIRNKDREPDDAQVDIILMEALEKSFLEGRRVGRADAIQEAYEKKQKTNP